MVGSFWGRAIAPWPVLRPQFWQRYGRVFAGSRRESGRGRQDGTPQRPLALGEDGVRGHGRSLTNTADSGNVPRQTAWAGACARRVRAGFTRKLPWLGANSRGKQGAANAVFVAGAMGARVTAPAPGAPCPLAPMGAQIMWQLRRIVTREGQSPVAIQSKICTRGIYSSGSPRRQGPPREDGAAYFNAYALEPERPAFLDRRPVAC